MAAMDDMLKKMLGIEPGQIAAMGTQATQFAQFVIDRLNSIEAAQKSSEAMLNRILSLMGDETLYPETRMIIHVGSDNIDGQRDVA